MEGTLYFEPLASSGTAEKKNKVLWRGGQYPAYIRLDLKAVCTLEGIRIFTPKRGYTQYSVYTGLNDSDYQLAYRKTTRDACPAEGEFTALGGKARFILIYVEYCSESVNAVIEKISLYGNKTDDDIPPRMEIVIPCFADTPYAAEITGDDVLDEVYGIIERTLGEEYREWFLLDLQPGEKDFFSLCDEAGRVKVTGNNGVSLATGINHYLKYWCNVHISQFARQVQMPQAVVPIGEPVLREAKVPVRYAYNYCTHSYTMPFWGEEEWRRELDFLALSGANVILDLTALEEVWRRFLMKLGYNHDEIKQYLTGPAYYAWAYMANISGFGGPVHDSWFARRTQLARKNQRIMRTLGMSPVLQAYNGMVPLDIAEKRPTAKPLEQGLWNSFDRPLVLKTTHPSYTELARLFYACEREVYGDITPYFAADLFHEGGKTGMMSVRTATQIVMEQLLDYRADACWIIQGWGENPRDSMLSGLQKYKEHCLILDLYAEARPQWEERNEFKKLPWVYCALVNFGGRMGLNGHLDSVYREIPRAMREARHLRGVGITPESSGANPIITDLLFDLVWDQSMSFDEWISAYARRRYGASDSAYTALTILKETVYKAATCGTSEGAPESILNARPCQDVKSASTWSNSDIRYDKVLLEQALKLMLEDYDTLKNSDGYLCDLADLMRQVLSNAAQEYQKKMNDAFAARDREVFEKYAALLLDAADMVDQVSASRRETTVGHWIHLAEKQTEGTDDLTKFLYTLNARALITTWGSRLQANDGQLKDYSNRQWAGLTRDFYKKRWELFLNARREELFGSTPKAFDWFEWEWEWVRAGNKYSFMPNQTDLCALGEKILSTYTTKA